MDRHRLCLFALQASREFGSRVSEVLGIPLSEHEERAFEDGEHKTRALVSVRGKDAFVVQSLYGELQESVNDKLCRLLFFIGALKDAAASRVIAVVPYLCYARKDRKTKPRDPVTTRYVAGLFEAVGTDAVVTLDVHNLAAFQAAWSQMLFGETQVRFPALQRERPWHADVASIPLLKQEGLKPSRAPFSLSKSPTPVLDGFLQAHAEMPWQPGVPGCPIMVTATGLLKPSCRSLTHFINLGGQSHEERQKRYQTAEGCPRRTRLGT